MSDQPQAATRVYDRTRIFLEVIPCGPDTVTFQFGGHRVFLNPHNPEDAVGENLTPEEAIHHLGEFLKAGAIKGYAQENTGILKVGG